MGRPRKNPDDPKWNINESQEPESTIYDWRIFFAAALGGLIARGGGLSYDQMIATASQIATDAQTVISSPRK